MWYSMYNSTRIINMTAIFVAINDVEFKKFRPYTGVLCPYAFEDWQENFNVPIVFTYVRRGFNTVVFTAICCSKSKYLICFSVGNIIHYTKTCLLLLAIKSLAPWWVPDDLLVSLC